MRIEDVKGFLNSSCHIRKSSKSYSFFAVLNYSTLLGCMGHFIFIVLFAFIGVRPLLYFNVLSVLLYVLCFMLNRKGFHNQAFYLGVGEILLHAYIATAYLGWDSGFHYYVLCLVPFFYFCTKFSVRTKVFHTILCTASYIGLNAFMSSNAPFLPLELPTLRILNYINIFVLFTCLAFLSYYYSLASTHTERDLKEINRKLEFLASIDSLTGLLNRRSMLREIEFEVAQYRKTSKPFSLILADIDNFKAFNDCYGHECGDSILIHTANIMKNVVREQDSVARWGGEEFLLLLPQTDREECKLIVERIKNKLEDSTLLYEGIELSVTLTFGISVYSEEVDISTLINKADQALYRGKHAGKNCVAF